jgi:glycerol-3-phosphate dehydrogenase (NAD(P)+)
MGLALCHARLDSHIRLHALRFSRIDRFGQRAARHGGDFDLSIRWSAPSKLPHLCRSHRRACHLAAPNEYSTIKSWHGTSFRSQNQRLLKPIPHMKVKKASVIGAGSWGTAISMLLAEKAEQVLLWGRDPKTIQDINHKRVNRHYLPREEVPANVTATTDFADLADSQVVIVVTPSSVTREVTARAAAAIGLSKDVPIVSASKGVEAESGKRMTEILSETFVGHPVAVLSGPSHAEEVARHMATAAVIGCADSEVAAKLQELFTLPFFRTYTSKDVIGIEYGGAVKNVFALAGGIADGLGLGDNAKAALVTRGLAELVRLGTTLGGDPETFQGLSGVGDLIVTCYSTHSRNNRVGQMIGKGHSLDEINQSMHMVVEGIPNTKNLHALAKSKNVRTPIIDEVNAILYENKSPEDALSGLLNRDPRPEAG